MTLIIRRPRTQQPQQVGAASGDALSAGLLTLNNFSASRAATYGSQTFSLAGSGHIMRPTSAGIGLSGAGTGRLQGSNLTVVGDVSSSSFAVFLHFALNATGQTNKYAIYQKHSTGSQQAALIYGYVANSFEFYSDGYGGTDPRTGSQIVVTDTRPHALLYTLSNGVWAGYLDGQRVFSTSRSFSLPSSSVSSAWLLDIDTPVATLNATLLSHATFGRGLPDGLAREFTARPGLLFAPQRIWVPVSAGGGINASVTLTGCSAASAAGATVALGSATAALSGASSAASAGTVTASAGSSASITLSGASSASAAGSLLATAGATAVLSGTSSASAAGAVAASAGASVTVVGSAASSAAGALTATAGGNAVATLTGASATSTAGSLTAGGSAGISLAGVGAAGAAGAVTATAGGAASVTLTGASASAAAGILAGFGGAQITLTGASASGAAGSASASAGSGSGTGATAAEIWSYTLSNGLTAEATLVAVHTMLSELHLIHGLTAGSPLSVTAASRAAGAVSQAVAEAAGTVTVTRQ